MTQVRMMLALLTVLAAADGTMAAAEERGPATRTEMEANKRVVLDFWRVVIEAKDLTHVGNFLAPGMVQHNPTIANGIDGFATFARTIWPGEGPRPVEAALRNISGRPDANCDI